MTIEQLIKLILGILVFVAVVIGLYLFFRDNIIDFFKNLGGNETNEKKRVAEILLFLIK